MEYEQQSFFFLRPTAIPVTWDRTAPLQRLTEPVKKPLVQYIAFVCDIAFSTPHHNRMCLGSSAIGCMSRVPTGSLLLCDQSHFHLQGNLRGGPSPAPGSPVGEGTNKKKK